MVHRGQDLRHFVFGFDRPCYVSSFRFEDEWLSLQDSRSLHNPFSSMLVLRFSLFIVEES